MKCRECKKREGTIQVLRKPWAAPVKMCQACAKATKGRAWYGQE